MLTYNFNKSVVLAWPIGCHGDKIFFMNCSFYLFCCLILHDSTYFSIKLYYIIVVEPSVKMAITHLPTG